ncbi:hypothetical protein BMS3Abin03_02399 [bacterium BMS3Abin03]|nr:hypothetical protein BMS3Abin03_02399 [bacterium BMS3Abin03]
MFGRGYFFLKISSIKFFSVPVNSLCENGNRFNISILPASDSEILGKRSTLDEPVRINLPALRFLSTTDFIAGKISGTFCTSSIASLPL